MKVIAIYPGRFQPFGKHHAKAFEWLQNKFGKQNSFIATSNVTDANKSPFNFDLKKQIIQQYGVSPANIVQVKDPYKAVEITSKFNSNTTAIVFLCGEKDFNRISSFKKDGSSGYYQKYIPNAILKPMSQCGYILTIPHIKLEVNNKEMSGTTLRDALKKANPQSFKQIMGWYNPSIYNQIKATLVPLTKEGWVSFFNLLNEGGAAGHMAHPFEIEWVKNGKDLLKVFYLTEKSLKKNPAAVKIDGINISLKLITLNGIKQFALDRGSNLPLDVRGVTKEDLVNRFGQGHKLVEIGEKVLHIFNKALNETTNSLKLLKLWDNPNLLLNVEYVSHNTNVLQYSNDFLAIHGLLEIFPISNDKRKIEETSYDYQVMQKFIEELTPIASTMGYQVVGSIDAQLRKSPDFNKILKKQYTINIDGEQKQTMTLLQGLLNAIIPNKTIRTIDGKSISALSKEILLTISKQIPISQYISNPNDYKLAIDSFFIYTATIELGKELLKSMQSKFGPVQNQEGIVIRDKNISIKPFKITGDFILKSINSTFND